MEKIIYFDNNATTPLHPEVKKTIIEMTDLFGNPSSMHNAGRIVKDVINESIYNIADFFGADENDIVFTSCATESNNMILKSVLTGDRDFKPHVIISNIEHPSVLETARFLEKNGVDVTYLPVTENGVIDLADFEKALKKETVMVSIMFANNEIGTIQPIVEIGKITSNRGIFFHTDAVQMAGKHNFKLRDLPVDSASFSAHKMYAPKGIGLIYVKNMNSYKKKLIPLMHGGHQARGFRAGTENTIGIAAYGAACKALSGTLDSDIQKIAALRDRLEKKIVEKISDISINGKGAPRKCDTTNISFKYVEGESILLRLDLNGICVSTGSACSTGSLDPSHVIMALHHDEEIAHGSVRFSLGRENTVEEVDFVAEKVEETISFLRKISPLTPKR